MQETLVQGSRFILVSPGIHSVSVPVDQLRSRHPSEGVGFPQCEVRRESLEAHTCHVCEGGHHVHVTWDTWAW